MRSREQLRRIEAAGVIAVVLALASSACALLVETTDLTEGEADAAAPAPRREPRAGNDGSTDSTSPSDDPVDDPGSSTDPGGGATGAADAAPTTRDEDAGTTASQDSGEGGVQPSGIACGAQTCAPGSSVCCFSFDAGPVGCATSCAPDLLALPCDDTADCTAAGHPGNFCCITVGPSPDNHATSVQCRTSCPTGGGTTPFCDPNDNVRTCPSGSSCKTSTQNVPGYRVCK